MVVGNSEVVVGAGCGNTELQSAKFLRRRSAIGVFRTGPDPRVRSPFGLPPSETKESGVPRPLRQIDTAHRATPDRIQPCEQAAARLPCCRRFEAFELLDDGFQALRAFHLVIGSDLLPCEQKAYEVAARDRVDLLSQAIQGVAVNASEQASRAPLGFSDAGREFTANTNPSASSRSSAVSISSLLRPGRKRVDRLLRVRVLPIVRE